MEGTGAGNLPMRIAKARHRERAAGRPGQLLAATPAARSTSQAGIRAVLSPGQSQIQRARLAFNERDR
jgi:hypothetical protein